mmetsp:Transcript_90147/g.140812  ORF Transcript_90147/g.140812 Transcript_90147/m.140812 type:complete len:171 (-) Transcript_90147:14-526(-)
MASLQSMLSRWSMWQRPVHRFWFVLTVATCFNVGALSVGAWSESQPSQEEVASIGAKGTVRRHTAQDHVDGKKARVIRREGDIHTARQPDYDDDEEDELMEEPTPGPEYTTTTTALPCNEDLAAVANVCCSCDNVTASCWSFEPATPGSTCVAHECQNRRRGECFRRRQR